MSAKKWFRSISDAASNWLMREYVRDLEAENLKLYRERIDLLSENRRAKDLARALAATIHEGKKQSLRSSVAARPILAKIRSEDWSTL